jgi:cytoskeletal protein CcmA (bactofilin family)
MIFKKYGKSLLDAQVSLEPPKSDSRPFEAQEIEEDFRVSEDPQPPMEDEPDLFIAEGVTVKGELSFVNLLRLDGSFEGTIASGKKIIVGPKGHLKANLQLEEAYIAGKLEGDVCVQERLILRSRAEIYGNITAPRLSVDEGVTIVGQLLVSAASSKSDPVV